MIGPPITTSSDAGKPPRIRKEADATIEIEQLPDYPALAQLRDALNGLSPGRRAAVLRAQGLAGVRSVYRRPTHRLRRFGQTLRCGCGEASYPEVSFQYRHRH